jgi:hypothetical protein
MENWNKVNKNGIDTPIIVSNDISGLTTTKYMKPRDEFPKSL